MEKTGVDVDSNCDSLVESIHSYGYIPACSTQFGVMYNLFKPGSSFNFNILDSDSCSSDPIRADCSLNDGIATTGLCSPKEEFFVEPPKRTSIYIQIEDDEVCGLNNFGTNHVSLVEPGGFQPSFVSNIPQSYEMKESFCVSMLVDSNMHDENDIHSDLIDPIPHLDSDDQIEKDHSSPFCPNDAAQIEHIQSGVKHSEIDVKPSMSTSFLTMENSNNAIDNNLHASVSAGQCAPSTVTNSNNHIFKLPNNELTFNGTLKHLQKLQPILNTDQKEYKDEYNQEDGQKEDTTESFAYKSSDELTSASSPSGSAFSNKSDITVFSSVSQFPSDCDAVSNELPSKNLAVQFSDVLDSTSSVNKSTNTVGNKNLTFTGTVIPPKDNRGLYAGSAKQNSSNNRSGESLDSSYNSGPQSPNIFSDDEDEYNDQKTEAEKYDLILQQFEKCDTLLIKNLEKTLQGVLPPPSVTICQLTATDIITRYKENLARFNSNDQKTSYNEIDPEASISMTPPRRISSDSFADPSLSNSLAMAFENTINQTFDQSVNSNHGNDTLTADIPNKHSSSNGFLMINGTEDIATNEDWPQVSHYRYHGVHYNFNHHSETIDCLLSRYTSRYVGCETASSCTVVPVSTGSSLRGQGRRTQSATIAGAPSPGRRLSHLAKRRAAFCTAATIAAPLNRRQILIDRNFFPHRKYGCTSRTRRTPGKKTPGKKTPGKKTPSSAQKKNTARRLGIEQRIKSQPTRETSKRALFLSPENVTSKPLEILDASKPSTSRAVRSKRALFSSPEKSDFCIQNLSCSDSKAAVSFNHTAGFLTGARKRNRMDDSLTEENEYTPSTKLQKSLTFGGDKVSYSCSNDNIRTLTRRATEFATSNSDLKEIHKKKLLWAVAEALRAHGIGMSHESFKQHATALVRLTRKLCTLPAHQRALKTPFSSTSDTLLKIARLHVFSVIKGCSVDELFLEEQTKQMNAAPTKVTGYIPLNSYEPNKMHVSTNLNRNSENSYGDVKVFKPDLANSNKKTVLQDKTVNIDTKSNGSSNGVVEPDLKKPTLFKDGNKLKARRQISFDNVEDHSKR